MEILGYTTRQSKLLAEDNITVYTSFQESPGLDSPFPQPSGQKHQGTLDE